MLNFTKRNPKLVFLKYYHLHKITLLIVLLIFLGCKSAKNVSNQSSQIENEPKILFLNYNIKKTAEGKRQITYINKKITNGKIKQNPFEPIENGIQGDLIFTEINKKEKVISEGLIKNPLIKKIEYVDESKHFKTKVIDFDEIQFSIRLQSTNDTKYITISNFAKNEPLIKTQIRQL
jgi:long-subunit acyl-CoA synthetase (AMP-forming)